MAVYQAARRTPAFPVRRRVAAPQRANRRTNTVGMLLAVILTAFLLALIYLTQAIQVSATVHRIDELTRQRDDLARQIQSLEGTIARWGAEPMVLERAQQLGLDRLGAEIRLPGR